MHPMRCYNDTKSPYKVQEVVVMGKFIEQLWYGNIVPFENFARRDAEMRAFEKRYCNKICEFELLLNNKQKDNFEKLSLIIDEYVCEIQKKSFYEGFSLGVRLTSEAFNESENLL